jgi:hypothetical protein
MYLQEILEVAIGLIFVWLVLSVGTMSLQEWIGNILNLRARGLEKAIVRMLSSQDLARRFYAYPLITNLYQKPKKPGQKGRLPSYIPPDKFAATIFELIVQAGTDNSPIQTMSHEIDNQLGFIESPEQQNLARQDWDAILGTARNIAISGSGTAGLDSLKFQIQAFGEKFPELGPTVDVLIPQVEAYYGPLVEEQRTVAESGVDTGLAMRQFRLGTQALQGTNPGLNESAGAILRQTDVYALRGELALNKTLANLESWFNDAMTQLSDAYKRRAQVIAFIIGLILALILNVDSVGVATSLWREPTLRLAIIAQAQYYPNPAGGQISTSTSPLENIPALETQLQALNLPLGWTIVPIDTGGSQCSILPVQAGQVMGIPILSDQGQPICNGIKNLPVDLNSWLKKILGLLITGAAASQGAPFWFDILKKAMSAVGAGTKPAVQKAAA